MNQLGEDLKGAGRTILAMMRHLEIPPGTVLTGEIPGEMAYEVWANEQDRIQIRKTGDFVPEADNPNIKVIECSGFGCRRIEPNAIPETKSPGIVVRRCNLLTAGYLSAGHESFHCFCSTPTPAPEWRLIL
jgi:hypothetical protein